MKRFLAVILFGAAIVFAQTAGRASTPGYAGGVSGGAAASESPYGETVTSAPAVGIRTPFFLGAALGFGSGTGVGSERGLGLRQIEPMFGFWFPRLGFVRFGYGFFDYQEEAEDKDRYKIEHSNFDVDLGLHIFGDLYLMGNYSRAKELSDLGDVAWNEWSAGFGTLLNLFSKTLLFAELQHRWVLEHYDPFLEKTVSGTRLQLNIGFAVYVY